MRTSVVSTVIGSAVYLAVSTAVLAEDRWLGTWKLNVAQSKYSSGAPPRSTTIKVETTGGGLKYTADGIDAQGTRTHTEYVAKFDGGDYPFRGSPTVDSISLRRIDDSTYEAILKKAGTVVTTARTVISKDGRTRITMQTGKNAQGEEIKNTIVYNKQ